MRTSKLKQALELAVRGELDVASAIASAADQSVASAAEAELVVQLLERLPLASAQQSNGDSISPQRAVAGWFHSVQGDTAARVLERFGTPKLLRVFDEMLASAVEDASSALRADLMFMAAVIAMYAPRGGLGRIVDAARSGVLSDEYTWSVVFDIVSQEGHPWQPAVLEQLRQPLPRGFAAVAFLDYANTLARERRLERHPYDSAQGFRLLSGWLASPDQDQHSFAHSATVSLPFLSEARQRRLLPRAMAHPDRNVRLEAAWALAMCGDSAGLDYLQKACADPRDASVAMQYLDELDAGDRIPLVSNTADFQAMAEMCRWLAHPREFGRPPDEITLYDSRELYWPPTDDCRTLWLFRYAYHSKLDEPDVGLGMVGSVTFALFGETTAEKTPEQAYALHCAWELEVQGDSRAPSQRSVEAGSAILREYNPGFSAS